MNVVDIYSKWFNRFTVPQNVWKRIIKLNYSISREMAPVFTMGSQDPRSMQQGRQRINGTFSMIIDNKEELRNMMRTIKEHGIEITQKHDGVPVNILCLEGVDIINDNYELTMFEQDTWGNFFTFQFIAKRLTHRRLS